MRARKSAEHESDGTVNWEGPPIVDDDGADGIHIQRTDEEDHDLLTFGEAGARLREEVIRQEREIARLGEAGAADDLLAGARRRLDALRRAAERNRAPSLDDLRSSGFFGSR